MQGFLRYVPFHSYRRNLGYKTAQVFITSSPSLLPTSTPPPLQPQPQQIWQVEQKLNQYNFFTGHNIAFCNFDHFTDMPKDTAPDSHYPKCIFGKVEGTSSCTKYWANCTKTIIEGLQTYKFSIIIVEP